MYNLIVSGNGESWEQQRLTFPVERFKEYSGNASANISLTNPGSLTHLEQIPTLLMYEDGASGDNHLQVRHGRLRGITRRGRHLEFSFEPDQEQTYLDRTALLGFADEMGIETFERYRTHWAIKDQDIPLALLESAATEPVRRSLQQVSTEYIETCRQQNRHARRRLLLELDTFPPSFEKAMAMLPARLVEQPTPVLYPLMGIERRTAEGRAALEAVLRQSAENGADRTVHSFSLAWFIDVYGSPTELVLLTSTTEECRAQITRLGVQEQSSVEQLSLTLILCSRSRHLTGKLRREIEVLIDRLTTRQHVEGYWEELNSEGIYIPGTRSTAQAIVVLQRLGDDRYHDRILRAVTWLITQVSVNTGAWPHNSEGIDDPIATVFALEAIRRSNLSGDLIHVLERGETWLIEQQNEDGGWVAAPRDEDFVTSLILEYLAKKSEILAQVDGFLLMSRDFFRRAEHLQSEEGANNRRLSAIAAVHSVEMFLYGLFDVREDFGLSAYRDNGADTIGLRQALVALQDALRRMNMLGAAERLSQVETLRSLISKRDGIIHRAHEISEAELTTGIKHARRFIEKYGRELLGLNLLQ